MKQPLLTLVQKILSDMDAEEVNTINDTTEAQQIASIIEDTYYNIVSNRTIPEHNHLVKLTAVSDSAYPTHFEYPDKVDALVKVDYDTSDDGSFEYSPVTFVEPEEFLAIVDVVNSTYVLVDDRKAGTKLRIRTDKMPEYWTSFDDTYIVMDSYKSTVDSTLQSSKTRAWAKKTPEFNRFDDDYVPEIDSNLFPLLLNESKSVAMAVLGNGPNAKIDQAARRQRYHYQNDRYKTVRDQPLSKWGR